MHDIDNLPLIELGHQAENDVCKIQFDVTDWLADYPEGVFSITYIRPTETAVYPVAAGDLAVSTVDDAEDMDGVGRGDSHCRERFNRSQANGRRQG